MGDCSMSNIIVVGIGRLKGWTGSHWAITRDTVTLYILPENMFIDDPREGLEGILTYEYKKPFSSRVNCFREVDDKSLPCKQ
jgi:hypothetical protein